ncbi:hypothetical protein ABEB36_002576 [Hypothenemus hampei]|uniref:Uncharacterized protein n=1 Tax=Hypothenemus hampei TaxID=57062 RepID=A0ABD1F690_HYPHA
MNTEETRFVNIAADSQPENQYWDTINMTGICRVCANESDKFIGIFSENGLSNGLADKLNRYLPINVTESDRLPLQCCWQCASTVFAWHNFVETCVEVDQKLNSYEFIDQKQLKPLLGEENGNDLIQTCEDTSREALMAVDSISDAGSQYEPIHGTDDVPEVNAATYVNETHSAYLSIRKDLVAEDKLNVIEQNEEINNSLKELESLSDNSEAESENIYKFECMYCPTFFGTQLQVLDHLKEAHLKEKDADKSRRKTASKTNLKQLERNTVHVRHMTKHPLPKINREEVNKAKVEVDGRIFYMCKQCGKSLHSLYTYVWHIRIHTGERPYVCSLCKKQFRVSQGLVRHLKETHERIKNFECDICGRHFATKRNVEEHRRIHTNERPYVCDTCGKSFKQKASLFVHNRSHSTEFSFSCSECSQKFRTKRSLLMHATKHTGEKPFSCDVCGRNFRIKYELKRHKLVHSEEKPFSCRICSQAFRQKRYLRNHLKLNHHISNPNEYLEEYINAI